MKYLVTFFAFLAFTQIGFAYEVQEVMGALQERQTSWEKVEEDVCRVKLGITKSKFEAMRKLDAEYGPRFDFLSRKMTSGYSEKYAEFMISITKLYTEERKAVLGQDLYELLQSERKTHYLKSTIVASLAQTNPDFDF